MFIYSTKRHKTPIKVSSKQLLLLKSIGSLGFVNSSQLDLLWSVINKVPSEFSKSILSTWCTYDGLLKFVHKSSSTSPSAIKRSVYVLTSSAKKWLDELDVLPASDDLMSINSHNEQAIEVIVQGLYTACFKSNELGLSIPYFISNYSSNYIGIIPNYSFINRCQNMSEEEGRRCQDKGELKGVIKVPGQELPDQDSWVLSVGAKDWVKKRKMQQNESIATDVLISTLDSLSLLSLPLSDAIPVITYITYCLLVEGLIKDDDINSLFRLFDIGLIDDSDITVLDSIDSFQTYLLKDSVFSHRSDTAISTLSTRKSKKPKELDIFNELNLVSSINSDPSYLAPDLLDGASDSLSTRLDKRGNGTPTPGTSFISPFDWHLIINFSIMRDACLKEALFEGMFKQSISKETIKLMGLGSVDELGGGRKLVSINNSKQVVDNFNDYLNYHFIFNSITNYPFSYSLFTLNSLLQSLGEPLVQWDKTVAKIYEGRKLVSISNSNLIVDNFKESSLRDEHKFIASSPKKKRYKYPLKKKSSPSNKKSANKDGLLSSLQTDLDSLLEPESQNKSTNLKASPDSDENESDSEDVNKIFASMGKEFKHHFDDADLDVVPEKEVNETPRVPEGSDKLFAYTFNNLGINLEIAWVPELRVPCDFKLKDLSKEQLSTLLLLGVINLLLLQTKQENTPLFKNDSSITDYKLKLDSKDQKLINRPCWHNQSLISNPRFNIEALDLRSFNHQFGFNFGENKSLPFVADMMVSFKRPITNRRQEIFVELDNRTESNDTQIQKILNYVWYALDNKDKDIYMVLPITDGSLSSRRVPEYTNIGRKLGNLSSKFLRTYITGANGEKVYLGDLYKSATNLRIFISGVSEANIDIAECLLGSNYLAHNLLDIEELTSQLNSKTEWNVSFESSKAFRAIKKTPELLMNSEADITLPMTNNDNKGMLRYLPEDIKNGIKLGDLVFKTGNVTRKQSVFSAQEHSLDSLIANYVEFSASVEHPQNGISSSINLFPPRLQSLTAISLPEYAKKYNYLDSYIPVASYYFQPRYALDLQFMCELRWLTIQYSTDIYNYFDIGAINKAALKKGIKYDPHGFKLLLGNAIPSRSYKVLHELSQTHTKTKEDKLKFVNNLVLNEIPKELFTQLLERWPKGSYSPLRVQPLFYIKNPLIWKEIQPLNQYDFVGFIKPINSTIPLSRNNISF